MPLLHRSILSPAVNRVSLTRNAYDATRAIMTDAELRDVVLRFTDAFNRDDLEGVMSFLSDDAVYDEFNGKRSIQFVVEDVNTPEW